MEPAKKLLLADLPADVVQHILVRLTLAHHIARTAPTCHVVSVAARNAIKVRRFSSDVAALAGYGLPMDCVAAGPDGRVITGWSDGTVSVWRNAACERTIPAHHQSVQLAVLPSGGRFISGSLDGTAKLWTFGGELERTFAVGSVVYSIAALPGGTQFVVGLGAGPSQGEVRLYTVDGTLAHTFRGHVDTVLAMAVTRDGQRVVSGSVDKVAKVWGVASRFLVSTSGHFESVLAVAAMPDGQRFLSGSVDEVNVWLLNGTHENSFGLMHAGTVTALVALPDNKHALAGSRSKKVKLFNVDDGDVLRIFTHHTEQVFCLALLPDGRRFVSGSMDQTARIVEIGLEETRHSIAWPGATLAHEAASSRQHLLAAASAAGVPAARSRPRPVAELRSRSAVG